MRECYGAMKGGWKNGEHESWLPSFENHVFPIIGRMPIDQIDSAAVLRVLEPIWLTIAPTARRILQRIGTVLDRSEEHTSKLQSLMRNSYAVFCLKKKKKSNTHNKLTTQHIHQNTYNN